MRTINALGGGGGTVTPQGAVPVVSGPGPGNNWGWQDSGPLAPPPGQDAIERLVNAALPQPKPRVEPKAEAAPARETIRGRLNRR